MSLLVGFHFYFFFPHSRRNSGRADGFGPSDVGPASARRRRGSLDGPLFSRNCTYRQIWFTACPCQSPYSLKSGLLRMEIIRLLEERRHRQPQRSVRQAVLSSLEVVQSFALKHVLRGHRVRNLHDILPVFCTLISILGMCEYSHL